MAGRAIIARLKRENRFGERACRAVRDQAAAVMKHLGVLGNAGLSHPIEGGADRDGVPPSTSDES
jgi:hypothetical protein